MTRRRQSRPEVERFDAMIALTRQGFASFTRSLVEVVIMAGIAGGFTQVVTDDLRLVLRGAGWAALGILFLVMALAAVILLALVMRDERQATDTGSLVGRIAPRHWITAADGWTWDTQRSYLIAVRDGAATFSQRGAVDLGHEADAFNALLRRMVMLGFYETHNADNFDNRNGGSWSAEGRDMLAFLDNDE